MTTHVSNFTDIYPLPSAARGSIATPSGGQISIEFPDAHIWDALAAEFDDAVHEQTGCFNAARWGKKNIENVAFRLGGKIIGGASVIIFRLPVFKTGIAIVKWGPLWRKNGEAPNIDYLKTVLSLLQEEFAGRRGLYLTVMPTAAPVYTQKIVESLQALGFKTGRSVPAPERYLVNVAMDEEERRKSLSQKWRYNLKKSAKHGFEIKIVKDHEGFESFMSLYKTMLERKKFNDTSAINTLENLMEIESETFRPLIVLLSHQGVLTAGAVIDMSGDQAVYLYGATDDRALSLNAGYAIHWFIADHLSNLKSVRWYDLGGNDLDGGLHQFKKGFVGKTGVICENPPSYHYASTGRAQLVGNTVFMFKHLKRKAAKIFSDLKTHFDR